MRNARKRVLGGRHESEITPERVFHMLRRLLRRLHRSPVAGPSKTRTTLTGCGCSANWCRITASISSAGYGTRNWRLTLRSSGNGRIRSGAGPPSKSNGSSPAARSSSRCGSRLCSPRLRAFRITLISDEAPHRQIAVNAERAYRVVVAVQSHLDGTPILDKKGKDTLACVPHLAYRLHHQPGARALCGTHAEPE